MSDRIYVIDDSSGIPTLDFVEVERREKSMVRVRQRVYAFRWRVLIPADEVHDTPEAAITAYVAEREAASEKYQGMARQAKGQAVIAEALLSQREVAGG